MTIMKLFLKINCICIFVFILSCCTDNERGPLQNAKSPMQIECMELNKKVNLYLEDQKSDVRRGEFSKDEIINFLEVESKKMGNYGDGLFKCVTSLHPNSPSSDNVFDSVVETQRKLNSRTAMFKVYGENFITTSDDQFEILHYEFKRMIEI
jgi:hypothetical protein